MDTQTGASLALENTTIHEMQENPEDGEETQNGSRNLTPPGAGNTTEAETVATQTKLCAVCHEQEFKYKCSKCYLP